MSVMYKMSAMFVTVKLGDSRSKKRNKSEVGKRKTVRDLRRDNKGNMREVCFLKTHMFLEITQEKEGMGEEKHMRVSERGVGVVRYSEIKSREEGRLRQENLVPTSNNLC